MRLPLFLPACIVPPFLVLFLLPVAFLPFVHLPPRFLLRFIVPRASPPESRGIGYLIFVQHEGYTHTNGPPSSLQLQSWASYALLDKALPREGSTRLPVL